MSIATTLDPVEDSHQAEVEDDSTERTALLAVTVAIAIVTAATGIWAAAKVDPGRATDWVAAGVLTAWAAAAVAATRARATEPFGPMLAAISVVGSLGFLADAYDTHGGAQGWESMRTIAIAIAPAIGLHLALGLPDGRLLTTARRVLTAIAYAAGAGVGLWASASDSALGVPVTIFAIAATAVAVAGFVDRCRRAPAADRVRLQWAGWGVVVAGLVALVIGTAYELISWPSSPAALFVAATVFVPLGLALSAQPRLAVHVDRILVHTIVVAGLVALVGAVYLVVVLGLGDSPDRAGRRLLGLSILAAGIATVAATPARRRLDAFAHARVYGERRSPEEALQTFGNRMSRAVPMDELLLQLVETLKKSMQLAAAEVWTGGEGVLERAVAVPDRPRDRIVLSGEELLVVGRAQASGNAWLQVWIPGLVAGRETSLLRVAPITHSGSLLGLIVAERSVGSIQFTEEESRALTELARQVGLALHNVRLDSALQASLDELQRQAEELRASRTRIVATADQARRQIERNLHDGAQQHIVALAVKLGLARQLLDADPAATATLLEELRGDAQATLTELRELAHGIYPPLLMDRGLPEALQAAANRAVLPAEVAADVGRYAPDVEAAIYFCCLEAMQNAGKHAGADARLRITVTETDGNLCFEVVDDGAGFDMGTGAARGHGFVNMADRLGAIDGRLEVESAPGSGTRISGRIPIDPPTAP